MNNETKPKMTDEEKREYKRAYMRNWKREKYAKDPESIKECNRTAYYKAKYNGTKEDVEEYGDLFPLVSKITSGLENLREQNVELFRNIIRKYNFEIPEKV